MRTSPFAASLPAGGSATASIRRGVETSRRAGAGVCFTMAPPRTRPKETPSSSRHSWTSSSSPSSSSSTGTVWPMAPALQPCRALVSARQPVRTRRAGRDGPSQAIGRTRRPLKRRGRPLHGSAAARSLQPCRSRAAIHRPEAGGRQGEAEARRCRVGDLELRPARGDRDGEEVVHRVAGDGGARAAGQVGCEPEVEAEHRRRHRIDRLAVEGPEEDGGQRDREGGAQQPLETALHEAAEAELVGDSRREADAEQCEPERATAHARQREVEARERTLLAQPGELEHAVETVAQRDGADDEDAEQANGEASRAEPEARAERKRREGCTRERDGREEDLEPEALEREALGPGAARGQGRVAGGETG